jgi:predicted HTH domain antitoxin
VWSWQEFELDLADRIICLYHRQLKLAFGRSSKLHPYETLEEAVDLIEAGIQDATYFRRTHGSPSLL